ncbi:MAG: OmpA family protein [Myxococcota bacterium]|nr:OmpA family protein [Myxococcota bacterium]
MPSIYKALSLSLLLLGLAACTPDYPKCETDEHCAEKGEFCVAELCRKCREDSHCSGAGEICQANSCVRRPGYCDTEIRCPGVERCRENSCGPQCLEGNPDDCAGDEYCSGGRCLSRPQCGENALRESCDEGFDCVSGRCQRRLTTCRPSEPIYFGFDRSRIERSQRSKLEEVAECLRSGSAATVLLAGHTDKEGSPDYNMSLGENRANAVRDYLIRLGVSSSLLSTVSYGEEQPAVNTGRRNRKNRRVEFNRR